MDFYGVDCKGKLFIEKVVSDDITTATFEDIGRIVYNTEDTKVYLCSGDALSQTWLDITVGAGGSGESNDGINLGDTGHNIYTSNSGVHLQFKKLLGGTGIDITDKNNYLEIAINQIDHGDLEGLSNDDHTQYSKVDGTRAYDGPIAGTTPTTGSHLTTKDYVDNLVNGLDWQESVLDKDLTTPPTPTSGNRYIIGIGASGVWSGHDMEIVEGNGTDWDFTPLSVGFACWVEDENIIYNYNGTSWIRMSGVSEHGTLSGLDHDDHNPIYYNTTRLDRWFETKLHSQLIQNQPHRHYITDDRNIDDQQLWSSKKIVDTINAITSLSETVTQTDHMLSVEDVVRKSGNIWIKAQADSTINAEALGIVTNRHNANEFTVTFNGKITCLTGKEPDTVYYLSPTTAGLLTSTKPNIGQVVKSMIFTDSDTSGYMLNHLGVLKSTATSGITTVYKNVSSDCKVYITATDPNNVAVTEINAKTDYSINVSIGNTLISARFHILCDTTVTIQYDFDGISPTGYTDMIFPNVSKIQTAPGVNQHKILLDNIAITPSNTITFSNLVAGGIWIMLNF